MDVLSTKHSTRSLRRIDLNLPIHLPSVDSEKKRNDRKLIKMSYRFGSTRNAFIILFSKIAEMELASKTTRNFVDIIIITTK